MTNRGKGTWKSWPWFVVLLGAAAPMILYANNLGEVTLTSLWVPVVASILVGLVIFGITFLILKKFQIAGLVTGLIELFIFSYGHFYNLLKNLTIFGYLVGRHRYLFPILLLIVGILVWRILKYKGNTSNVTLILNVITSVLFVFQFIKIAGFEFRTYQQQHSNRPTQTADVSFQGERPDVYIILLDAYMRSDWLSDSIGFDNSDFIQGLEDLGFVVQSCSRSNYSFTRMSMTSELNMQYLPELFDPMEDIETSSLLKHGEVRDIFENLGYDTVFFQNFFPWLDINDGDYYLKPEDVSTYDPFEALFLQTTVLAVPYDLFERQIAEMKWSPDHEDTTRYANLIQFIFEYLQKPHDYDEPVFVYAHILSPHYPYVFNADGSINYDWHDDTAESQRSTYQYLDMQTLKAVSEIIANSDPEPIIIIQSDHGSGEKDYKNLTLNAFFLPNGGEEVLYPTLTPVNFFRLIFDYYFDMDFDLLADKSYYSEEDSRYIFEEVQEPYDYCRSLSN